MGAIREEATSQLAIVAYYTTNLLVDTASAIIDTKDYESGITFALTANAITDGVKRTLAFEHSDTDVPGDFVPVDRSNLVYGRDGTDVYIKNETGGPLVGRGILCAIEGLIGTKRYVRAIVKKDGSSGGHIMLFAFKNAELPPPSEPGFASGSVIFT